MARPASRPSLHRLAVVALAAVLVAGVVVSLLPAGAGAAGVRQQPAQVPKEIGGRLTGSLVLTATNSPYLVSTNNLEVPVGVTLTIESGVQVQFGDGKSLRVLGKLLVTGATPGDVELTSAKPDKAPGDWPGIIVDPGGQATLRGVTVRYAGTGSSRAAITMRSDALVLEQVVVEDGLAAGIVVEQSATLRDVTVQRMAKVGVKVDCLGSASPAVELTRVTVIGCGEEAVGGPPNVQWTMSGNKARGNGTNGLMIYANIASVGTGVTWPAGDLPIVVNSTLTIAGSADSRGVLTLAADTIVKFRSGAKVTVQGYGVLRANGTAAEPVIFTALADDDACSTPGEDYCDTNNDGAATNANAGAWTNIVLDRPTDATHSEVSHAQIRYASGPALWVKVPDFSMSNVVIRDTRGEAGVKVTGVSATIAGCRITGTRQPPQGGASAVVVETAEQRLITLTLTDNTFENNDIAVQLKDPNIVLVNGGNSTPGDTNGLNGYLVRGGTVTDAKTWRAGDLPFVISGRITFKRTNQQLTLEPGVVVKMADKISQMTVGEIYVEAGSLVVGATGTEKVLVTSLSDDACSAAQAQGCDTNGDRDATTPTAGGWAGITILPSADEPSLRNMVIRYGGDGASQALVDVQHSGTVADCELSHSNHSGLRFYQAPLGTIANNVITDNAEHGLVLRSQSNNTSVFTLRGNQIARNRGHAIDMDANVELMIEGDENTLTDNTWNGIVVSGDSTKTHTWRNARNIAYIVTSDVRVANVTLTIQPGTVIKFGVERQGVVGALTIYNGGNLVAKGTADAPIVFTSVSDDRLIDSNPLQGAGDPAAGDWRGIKVDVTANTEPNRVTELSNVEIHYAGAGDNPALLIESPNTQVDALKITNGGGPGVRVNKANTSISDSTIDGMDGHCIIFDTDNAIEPALQRNTLAHCVAAVLIDPNVQLDLGGNTARDNRLNGIQVEAGTLRGTRTWEAGDLPFVLDQSITIYRGSMLAIEAGGVVKGQASSGINVEGSLQIPKTGSGDARVLLTTIHDDSCGAGGGTCDTNNNGEGTTPVPGDWNGIEVRSGAQHVTGQPALALRNVLVDYAGRTNGAVIIQSHGDTEELMSIIEGSEIAHSATSGVQLNYRANIKGSTFRGNVLAGVSVTTSGSGEISGNVFTENGRSIIHRGTSNTVLRDNVAIGNTNNPILYCATINSPQEWLRDIPREIDCRVQMTTSSLKLQPGLVLLFGSSKEMVIDAGTLEAQGVIFTSNLADAKPDSWSGLTIGTGASGAIRNSWMSFGGRSSEGVLDVITSKTFAVENNTFARINKYAVSNRREGTVSIQGNLFRGISAKSPDGSAIKTDGNLVNPQIKYNRMADVPIGIGTGGQSQPTIQFNNFAGTVTGVRNTDVRRCVSAQRNWWDDSFGPEDRSTTRDSCQLEGNPDGRGVGVSDNVNYLNPLKQAPPAAPLLDGPRCGVTNNTRLIASGTTSPEATVSVYNTLAQQPDTPIATVAADGNGAFHVELENLARGEYRLYFVASTTDGEGNLLRSAGTGFRVITVDDRLPVDPMGLRFEYQSGVTRWVQPVRDDAGCSVGCSGPSSGRVTLPAGMAVRVHLPVSGTPGSVVFEQAGRAPQTMTYDGATQTYATGQFTPVQGTFTVKVDGTAATCMGFIYLGGVGVVYNDSGVVGAPARLQDGTAFDFDFESAAPQFGWTSGGGWAVTEEQAFSGSHAWSDSPGGTYARKSESTLIAPGPVSLRSLSAPQIEFYHRFSFGAGDSGALQIRRGDEGRWEDVKKYTGVADTWQAQRIALDTYAGESRVHFRFLLTSNDDAFQGDGWYIDDVAITPGGALNGRYDAGEVTIADATVTLERQDVDTGRWAPWRTVAGQQNPQSTDSAGHYGFYYLEPGIYHIVVSQGGGGGVYTSPDRLVWNGTFVHDVPLTAGNPAFLPLVVRKGTIR